MNRSETEMLRVQNTRKLVQSLRVNGPIARIDLGVANQLSSATVTAITAELLAEGLILQNSRYPVKSGGKGRPKTLIDLNPKAAYVICIKLSINELRLVIGDFKGRIAETVVHHVNTLELDADAMLTLLKLHVQTLRDRADKTYGAFLGIAIAVQGIVAGQRGRIVWSPAVSFHDKALGGPLSEHFGCPVTLANDANCIGYALMAQPGFQHLRNFVVIMLGYGVGMAAFIDGRLYLGASGSAGEFGHTKFQIDGPPCACGKRGCVEAYISDYALYRDALAVLALPRADSLHPSEEQMQTLTQCARDGDPAARGLFDQAGRVLGVGLANVLALYNPELVVVSGAGVRAYDLMERAVEHGLEEALVKNLIGTTRIEPHPWDHDLTYLGGIALAIAAADAPSAA
jgi:predicted NBD/HSP70 family sugar kinase